MRCRARHRQTAIDRARDGARRPNRKPGLPQPTDDRRPRKPVPPNTVAVCAGAQDAFIPYRYRSPTHVAADQFGCVCAIPTLSWNASASPAYLRSLSNFGGYGTVDRCLELGKRGNAPQGVRELTTVLCTSSVSDSRRSAIAFTVSVS